ncbi:uncharacterized protein EV420DRAFT_1484342 [Desarmillaria tabescens]|uniref:Uncharacterized protein n=1 Tax=Armillaria tabescens TaxID=1929756 RepID=A0AA39JP55_ARMTA|nr:uncharacterized protein EV420DRAFT_1484342 [Desarmillaria tabescens]KAK0445286.1 hypothetical protein EV420DRAFT_1484342 [Desarmillaria tabescens]
MSGLLLILCAKHKMEVRDVALASSKMFTKTGMARVKDLRRTWKYQVGRHTESTRTLDHGHPLKYSPNRRRQPNMCPPVKDDGSTPRRWMEELYLVRVGGAGSLENGAPHISELSDSGLLEGRVRFSWGWRRLKQVLRSTESVPFLGLFAYVGLVYEY